MRLAKVAETITALIVEKVNEDPHVDEERAEFDNENPHIMESKSIGLVLFVNPALCSRQL